MNTETPEIFMSPIEDRYIDAIIKIAEDCGLSEWTYNDYLSEKDRKDSICFMCFNVETNQNKKILGFIISRLIITEISCLQIPFDFYSESECEILNIAVHSSAQKKGIGRRLLNITIDNCRRKKVKSIWLEVRKHNENAVDFYQKNNFEIVYTRKNYYRNPVEDALVMKAELP